MRREGHDPPDADGEAVLAPREASLIEESVTAVGQQRGRGPVVVAVLVAAAFLLGLLRPWDLVVSPDASPDVPGQPGPVGLALTGATDAQRTPPPSPTRQMTCAQPSEWRSSTIQDWAGRIARVWTAVDVVEATGPDDPAIPFEPIVAASVTAIGWCAPVAGPDRPPDQLVGTLYRVQDGVARALPYDRLEPAKPDALGELWLPRPRGVGNRPTWAMGHYVIELRSESGLYRRFLGLDLTDRVIRALPSPESPAASGAPDGSGGPSAAP
jgi:hypothetical protein